MNDVIDKLKKIESEYQKGLYELREKIRNLEDIPKADALIGKCFKYKNSNGSGKDWWLYARIVRRRDTYVEAEMFQEDSYGRIEFWNDKACYHHHFYGGGYIPATIKEYFSAQKRLINKMNIRHKKAMRENL